MEEEFRHVVANLWTSLGLSWPKFGPEGVTTLTVDGLDITLALSEDGRYIAISSRAGELSANPALMDEQVAHLLRSNLRILASNRACCHLDDKSSPTPVVMVQALAPCRSAFVDRLVEMIGDVADLAGECARELGGHAAPQAGRGALARGSRGRPGHPQALKDPGACAGCSSRSRRSSRAA